MGSTLEFRKAFVARLEQACDEAELCPPKNQGRQQYLAKNLNVGPEAVSKWFKGVAMPRPDKMVVLAKLLGTDQSWLAYGVKPEMDKKDLSAHVMEKDGAVHLVLGLIMLAGGHCGQPGSRDPRAHYVDFYATVRGSVSPVSVTLARSVGDSVYEARVPDEHKDARVVVVVPAGGAGKFVFLDLPAEIIEEYKHRTQLGNMITLVSDKTGYYVGETLIPKIKNFGDFH